MTLAFDLPRVGASPLTRWDPRWKLAALAPATVMFALLRTAPAAAMALAAALGLAAAARLPWPWLGRRLAWTGLLLALFLIWLPLLPTSEADRWRWGWVSVSVEGSERFANVLLKTLALVALMLVLLATAPLHDTLKAAQALRVPGLAIHLLLLTIRYVALIADEFARLRTALRVRGFRNRADAHSWRTIGHVAGTLMVRGGERAERVGHALRCRGFDGVFHGLHDFHTRWQDVAAWAMMVLAAGGLLGWDVWRR